MIGILDSGLGGLATARLLTDSLLFKNIVYLGDTAKWPYGEKSPETIRSFALKGAEYLIERGCRFLVVASHEISAVALERLTDYFSVEIFDAITPAADMALKVSRFSRIGVIGSRAVVDSGVYERIIKSRSPRASVYCVACPVLATLAVEGWLKKPETGMIVRKCIHPLKIRQIDTLIAGAAEFSVMREVIARKAGKRIRLIEPASSLSGFLTEYFKEEPIFIGPSSEKKGRARFFVSDLTPQLESSAKRYYGKNLVLEKADLRI